MAWGLLLGFAVLLVLALVGDVRQVSERMLAFRWALFPAVLGLTLFNYTLRFFKWHFYLGQIGVQGFSLRQSARLFVAGFPLAITPGKAGEALKGVWLQQESGIPVGRGVSVVVAERVSDGLAVMVLSLLGIFAYPRYWPAFSFILIILLGVVVVSQIRPLALALLGLGERLPLVKRFAPALREFYEGSFALFRPRATLLAVLIGTVSWLGEGLGMYIILLGLGVTPGWQALAVGVFALAFSVAVGAASTLPGGLGASEATIAVILSLALGLSSGTAAAATALIRFATLWFGVSLGLVVWFFSPHLLGLATANSPELQTEVEPE